MQYLELRYVPPLTVTLSPDGPLVVKMKVLYEE